jgi:metal-dependent HD superfamily phosphatase/phosphodiesterase
MYEEAIAQMHISAPAERNPRLAALLDAVNADLQLKAWWYAQQVTAERLQMSDHSWIHVQKVMNIALRLLRLLSRRGVEPVVREHGFTAKDAEAYSLFLAARKLDHLLEDVYEEPARSVLASETLHAIIGHRRRGDPLTLEAGIVRVADALDMEHGRSRVPFEANRPNIHSLSAAAIDDVRIDEGEDRAIRIEIEMNNSAGIFQVDELLATKLRGSGLEDHVEVTARIDAEHEKRLVPIFRI